MTPHKKSILGLLCMSALGLFAFGAFGVASASATTMHECVKNEVGTGTKYTDSTCSVVDQTKGEWQTKTLAANTSIPLTPTLTPTTFNGGAEEHAVMHGILHGIAYEITCTGIENGTVATTAENIVEGGAMKVHGTGKLKCTGATMKGEAATLGCTVPATIETVELTSISIDEAGEVMKAEYKPVTGTTLVGFPLANCTGAAAILNGTQNLKGHINATQTTPTSQTFHTGAGELTFGGAEAHFTATIHYKTTGTSTTVAFETP